MVKNGKITMSEEVCGRYWIDVDANELIIMSCVSILMNGLSNKWLRTFLLCDFFCFLLMYHLGETLLVDKYARMWKIKTLTFNFNDNTWKTKHTKKWIGIFYILHVPAKRMTSINCLSSFWLFAYNRSHNHNCNPQ